MSAAAAISDPGAPFQLGTPFRAQDGEPPSVHHARVLLGKAQRVGIDVMQPISFTPNGKHLIYLSRQEGLVRVDPDGRNPRVLYSSGMSSLLLTPDSRHVIFPKPPQILKVSLEGGEATPIATGVSSLSLMQLSPDGRLLMYRESDGPAMLIDINGGPSRVVARSMPLSSDYIHFTPDSKGIVYWSGEHTFYQPVRGEGLRRLAPNLEAAGMLIPWPTGAVVRGPTIGLWFAPYDGSAAAAFPAGLSVDRVWSNAELQVMQTLDSGGSSLYYVDAERRMLSQINQPLLSSEQMGSAEHAVPGWYVYNTYREDARTGPVWHVFAASTASGTSRAVARAERVFNLVARPTPDATRVIMHMDFDQGTRSAFVQADLRTGQLTRISDYAPSRNTFSVSPDSRHIAFVVTVYTTGSVGNWDLYTLTLPD